ncbi:hypothetical protein FHP25_01980 [Vineibacter terrae]|uniref:Mannosyl-glycoprotein endo-beta-N-acetylglucosamidase-like domain-containing protein n=1 Tax=Vineibacter terrae TaxID=2586908 RepID=A0A5C8PU51_9HYPH|nr:glucosaminidase domain-containing protein [Vineibacter terrae]TXL81858.1 hypothetical protein FHP25_01980 [Vineibacter terrae]
MNERIARAADFGRNYALIGAFGTCLLGAWAMPSGMTYVGVAAAHEAVNTHPAAQDAPLSMLASTVSWERGEIDLPLPEEAPYVDFQVPTLELAVADLPMADYAPLDPAELQLWATPVNGTVVSDEPRPLHGRLSHAAGPTRRQVTAMRVASSDELTRLFEAHDYTLDQARRGEPVPALQIHRVPSDLANIRDGNERKALFIRALLPIVLEANERILADRDHLLRLYDRHAAGRSLSVIERMWLAEVADRYGADSTDFDELLNRVDAVPPSMAIAQAGVESGWGTSYAARVGNSLFGQIRAGSRQIPASFANVAESVDAYFLNLNTHFAYASFRAERTRLRAGGKGPDGYHLIGQLLRYSELGRTYISFVRGVIRENRLSDFDRAKLPPI